MSSYKVFKADVKGPDWKVVDLEVGENQFKHNVSVNRTNKQGQIFPNFDAIQAGSMVEGELWDSPAGKSYLFAPKPAGAPRTGGGGPARNNSAIRENMDLKAASIQRQGEKRDLAMKLMGAMRDATLITLESFKNQPFPTSEEYKEEWRNWRDFFVSEFDNEFAQRDA